MSYMDLNTSTPRGLLDADPVSTADNSEDEDSDYDEASPIKKVVNENDKKQQG